MVVLLGPHLNRFFPLFKPSADPCWPLILVAHGQGDLGVLPTLSFTHKKDTPGASKVGPVRPASGLPSVLSPALSFGATASRFVPLACYCYQLEAHV